MAPAASQLRDSLMTADQASVSAFVAPGFEVVRDAFGEVLAAEGGLGASLGVYADGEKMVELWGGVADPAGMRSSAIRWYLQRHDDSTCATIVDVTTVGLRELRQNASELVRRVESGEEIEITVAGRPGARLVPVRPRAWRTYDEIAGLFAGRPDTDWQADREQIDQALRDPWGDE